MQWNGNLLNMKINKILTLIFFASIFLTTNVYSQDTINRNHKQTNSWFSLGIGGNSIGLASEIGLSFNHKPGRLFTAKCILSEEFDLFGNGANSGVEPAVLYGFLYNKGIMTFSGSAGLSLFFYHKKQTSYYNAEDHTTLSLPLEAKFLIVPSSNFALGLSYIGSFNGIRTYNGVLFDLCFGSFRPKKKK